MSGSTRGEWVALPCRPLSYSTAFVFQSLERSKLPESGRHAAQIRADMAEAQKAAFTGSPSFFLAYSDPRSTKVKTVARLIGAQPFASFKAVIDKLLAEPPGMPKDAGPER